MQTIFFLPVFALLTPFLLFPLELFLPFPFIIEELAKTAFLIPAFSIVPAKKRVLTGMTLGMFFALSETVLYIFNVINAGSLFLFLERALLTTILHAVTAGIIVFFGAKGRYYLAGGIILAMIVHYAYNYILNPF